jgi:hypothetical protein
MSTVCGVSLAAVLAQVLVPADARAVVFGPPPAPPPAPESSLCAQAPSLSADGTSGTCADRNYLTQCAAQRPTCEQLLGPVFQLYYDQNGSSATQVVLPPALPHPVDSTHAGLPGTLYDAVRITALAPATLVTGTGATFLSAWYPGSLPSDPIASCGHYVYQKWRGYADVDNYMRGARGPLGDRAAAEAAHFRPGVFYRADGQAIDVNGTPLPVLHAGDTIPRNAFLLMYPYWLDTTDPAQAAVLAAISGSVGKPATLTDATDLAMFDRLFGTPSAYADAKWRDNDKRQNDFALLLESYAEVEAALFHDTNAQTCAASRDISACSLWDQDGGDKYAGPGFSTRTFPSDLTRREAALDYYETTMNRLLDPTPGYRRPRKWPAYTADYYAGLVAQLLPQEAAAKQALQQALVAEYNYDESHGCLGNGTNANACDMSPRYLEGRYEGLFLTQREAAYDRCIAATGDDFTLLTSPARLAQLFLDPHLYNATGGPWAGTIARFEEFLNDYETRDTLNASFVAAEKMLQQHMLQETTSLPLVSSGAGAPQQIGASKEDADEKGGDWFGGGYSYGYGWHITPKVQDPNDPTSPICSLSGDAGARFEAHANVLKRRFTVVDGAFKVSSQPGKATLDQAHFTFLDKSYFNQDGMDFTGATFDQPIDDTPFDGGFSADIPVGPFLLQVGGGASLHVGADLHAAVVPPPVCDPANVSWSMNASITPHVRADAYAYVGIDLLVVSAGVEGNVELFGLDAPLSADVRLATDPTTGINLAVTNDARLQMSELAGDVSVFVDVHALFVKKRAELQLFQWDGFHQDVPLWHTQNMYPLNAINYRLYNHFNPNDVNAH